MSLTVAAEIATIVGAPLAVTNVGFTIHKALQSIRPYSKLKKWTIRVQHISAAVAAVGDIITPEELESFLLVLELYTAARDSYHQSIKDGTCTWYGRGKEYAKDFTICARDVFYNGHDLSTEASARKLRLCLLNNAQTSAVHVPATSTSPQNKGKSRQESSLSEESPRPSTSGPLASSGSCLPNKPQTLSSHNSDHPLPSPGLQVPPLYSEREGDNDAISVNSEDDTEDDSNDVSLEEVQAVYNKWRQIPEEQSPCASTATFYSTVSTISGAESNN